MAATTRASSPAPVHNDPDATEPVETLHRIRDHLTALSNALQVVRLAAGKDPRILNALDMADRQAKALVVLADGLHDQG